MQRNLQDEMTLWYERSRALADMPPYQPGMLDERMGRVRKLRSAEYMQRRLHDEYTKLNVPQPTELLMHRYSHAGGDNMILDTIEEMDAICPLPEDGPNLGDYDLKWYREIETEHRTALGKLIRVLKFEYEFEAIRDIAEEYEDAIKRSLTPMQRERRTKDLETIMNCL
jgi:hypothetical protein